MELDIYKRPLFFVTGLMSKKPTTNHLCLNVISCFILPSLEAKLYLAFYPKAYRALSQLMLKEFVPQREITSILGKTNMDSVMSC